MGPSDSAKEVGPEKVWDQMAPDERIEKLRATVHQLWGLINGLSGQLNRIEEKLGRHRHDERGDAYTKQPLDIRGGMEINGLNYDGPKERYNMHDPSTGPLR